MPSSVRTFSVCLIVCLSFLSLLATADAFATRVRQASLINNGERYAIQAQIDYRLSPTAKEALLKGIPLTWRVQIEMRETGKVWDSVIHSQELPYRLQFHALLNQYEVLTQSDHSEMFLTLNAALSYMSNLHEAAAIPASLLKAGQQYQLAIKCQFDRESLPVPLRPFAYLDTEWFLSSDWYLWPIQK